MTGLLKTIGILAIASKIFGAAGSAILNKINYSFGGLKLSDFNLFQGTIKLSLLIKNDTPVEATVESFKGAVIFGSIQLPITQDTPFSLPPGQPIKANFTIPVNNSELLKMLAVQIDTGSLPGLRIKGTLRVGYQNKVIGIPIDQNIQIL